MRWLVQHGALGSRQSPRPSLTGGLLKQAEAQVSSGTSGRSGLFLFEEIDFLAESEASYEEIASSAGASQSRYCNPLQMRTGRVSKGPWFTPLSISASGTELRAFVTQCAGLSRSLAVGRCEWS